MCTTPETLHCRRRYHIPVVSSLLRTAGLTRIYAKPLPNCNYHDYLSWLYGEFLSCPSRAHHHSTHCISITTSSSSPHLTPNHTTRLLAETFLCVARRFIVSLCAYMRVCVYICVCMFMLYNTYKALEGLKKTDESVVGRGRWNRLLMCFYSVPNSTNPQHTSYPDVIRINGKTTRRALTGLTDFIAKLFETTTSETFLKIIYQVFGRRWSELYKIY